MTEARKRGRLERVLFAILVHGPSAAFEHLRFIRNVHKIDKDAFREIQQTLIEAGMDRSEVTEMVLGQHDRDCACWRCIMKLHAQVLKSYHQGSADNGCFASGNLESEVCEIRSPAEAS